MPEKWLPTPLSPENPYALHGVEPRRRDYGSRLDRLGDVAPDGELALPANKPEGFSLH